jgi:chloride channel protein, CIC family
MTLTDQPNEGGNAQQVLRRTLVQRLGAQFLFNEDRFFLILAVFIGIFAGLAVVCFRVTMEWTRLLLLGSSLSPSHLRAFLAPSLTGLVISVLVLTVFRGARGSGLNQTKAALYISNGYIPFRTVIGKFITASLAIGSGHSLGPEDPSLQIGAGLASAIGTRLHLSRRKLRLLAPIGAAAGLAAAFNAPISAVLFVIEEIIGHWSAGILGSVVLAAVSGVVTMRWFLGAEPLFRIPPLGVTRWQELVAYAVLGILGGLASVIFSRAIAWSRSQLRRLPPWTLFFQPAFAGLLLGLIALAGFPQVMGAGYVFMDQAMHDRYTWEVLGILAGLKILSTTFSFVSGTPGGMFAPTLFVGAMLGASVGTVQKLLFPHLTVSVGAYALVGMGVLFAGFLRAPMTSVFMALEVSADYSFILPVLVANTFSYLIARQLQSTPILEVITRQDGLILPALEEERETEARIIEDAMHKPADAPVRRDCTFSEMQSLFESSDSAYRLIFLEDMLWYVVEKKEIVKFVKEGKGGERLSTLPRDRRVPYLYPDVDLEQALPFVQEWPLVPVVSRADVSLLLGAIDLSDVLDAYRNRIAQPSSGS